MDLLQPMMVATLITGGLGVSILGSLKLPLARRLQIDEARIGGLVSLFGFVIIPVVLVAGFLTDQAGAHSSSGFSKTMVVLAGSILMALSLAVLARAGSYGAAFVAVLLLSGAWATVANVGNVLTPAAFGGSPAYAFNLANVFFGLGAFITPMAVAFLLRHASFTTAVSIVAGFCLVPAALSLGARDPVATVTGQEPVLADILSNPILWYCGMALFFYGPLEASMGAWATTYLGGRGVSESVAGNLLSGFWLTFMAGRLLAALTLPDAGKSIALLVLSGCAFVVLLGMVLSRTSGLAIALVLLAGLVFGPVFPTVIAILTENFPPRAHGRAVGIFFAIGGVGWTFIPMLIGIYAKRTSVQRAFSIAAAAALGFCAAALLILIY